MGFPEIIAAAGVGLAAAGTAKSVSAAKGVAASQRDAIAAQKRAENDRQQQMNLDASRRRREQIRQSIQARSIAEANAVSQGAESSSGLQGGIGQISGRLGTNLVGVNQNQELGNDIFKQNRDVSAAGMRQASYQSQAALGQGLSSLGGSLITNIQPLNMLANYFTGNQYRRNYNA